MRKNTLSVIAAFLAFTMPANAQMITEKTGTVITEVEMEADLVVVGGGLSGLCAAVAAARHGTQVILIQDRPMLGGNTSSEVRMGICGSRTHHTYEAGIMEELQLKNFYYNPQQRYTLWDDVMYGTVVEEKNITLLLNTSVNDVVMDGDKIAAVKAWNTNAYTKYTIKGKLFADCSGDSILRLSGAKYRWGRELPSEFNETFLREGGDAHTMGNSILMQFHKTDVDRPFKAPEWAYHFTDKDFEALDLFEDVKKYKDWADKDLTGTKLNSFRVKGSDGRDSLKLNYKIINRVDDNNFWWCEFGGDRNTIADANEIQFELKRIAYGIWEYMKNHPDGRANGYELDWVGSLPGKRESARYEGPHILNQTDVMAGGHFPDVVAYGGWTLDDHDFHGFHNQGLASTEFFPPIPFGIPFSCMYSVNIPNLVFAGRNISATHIGFSSTRVMATCALMGQAVGIAANIALRENCTPDEVDKNFIDELQTTLEDDDCMLPFRWRKISPLTQTARTDQANLILKNGIDRNWINEDGSPQDNGVWVAADGNITYNWKKPVTVSGARLVFDSNFIYRGKRMRKLEGTMERVDMPKMLAKGFKIEACDKKGNWTTVYEEDNNILRLRKISFAQPVQTKALRLVITSAWGGENEKAHVFGFDAL